MPSELRRAVVEAIAYGDVFDWPMTPAEVHRYLPLAATPGQVEAALADPALRGIVEHRDGHVALSGRADLVARRRRRAAAAARLWPRAIRAGTAIAALPFVRLVAVTGSLSIDAVDDDADVDFLIVTEDRRLWLSRLLTLGLARWAAAGGLQLCPNYLLAESALEMGDRSLFTAHELAQMVPVVASPAYDGLLGRNGWFRDFLPNAGPRAPLASAGGSRAIRRLAERPLRTALGDRLERWEMSRKVSRLRAASVSREARYDEACCKGHESGHGRRTLAAFEARLARLEGVI